MKKIRSFFKNPATKGVLSALAVIVFGFILLNLTFLFDALFQNFIDLIVGLFTKINLNMSTRWFPMGKHLSFAILIIIISYFLFSSKLKTIYKSIFMTVPLMTLFLTIGIFLHQSPWIAGIIIAGLALGVFYYFYKTKQPWLYYYTLALICALMLIIAIFQIEI
ncbi:MAG: hypothetical protein WC516_01635 [Patescibacteria group bacterium]